MDMSKYMGIQKNTRKQVNLNEEAYSILESWAKNLTPKGVTQIGFSDTIIAINEKLKDKK